MCPGRYLSDNSLYSIVSSVLAVYNINAPVDESGKPKQLEANYTSGVLSYVFFLWSPRVSVHSLTDIPYLSTAQLSHAPKLLKF
jgi:hypothetical protein